MSNPFVADAWNEEEAQAHRMHKAFYGFSLCFKHRISITRACPLCFHKVHVHVDVIWLCADAIRVLEHLYATDFETRKEPIRRPARGLYDYLKRQMGTIYLWAGMWSVRVHSTDDCLRGKEVRSPCLKVVQLLATHYTVLVRVKIILKIVLAHTACSVLMALALLRTIKLHGRFMWLGH